MGTSPVVVFVVVVTVVLILAAVVVGVIMCVIEYGGNRLSIVTLYSSVVDGVRDLRGVQCTGDQGVQCTGSGGFNTRGLRGGLNGVINALE